MSNKFNPLKLHPTKRFANAACDKLRLKQICPCIPREQTVIFLNCQQATAGEDVSCN